MGWFNKLKEAQEECSHPQPYEKTVTLEGKNNKIYEVTTERCKPCRKKISIHKRRAI